MLALALFLALPILGSGSLLATAAFASPAEQKRILLLFSHADGGKGAEMFKDAFGTAMSSAGFSINDLYFEFLDLERSRDDKGYRQHQKRVFAEKYARRNIGLIVTVQQPALDFLLQAGRYIAPRAPVIAVHAPMPTIAQAQGRHIVSLANNLDIKGTLEYALKLFPQTQRVFSVTGRGQADKGIAGQAEQVAALWQGKLVFESSGDLSLAQMLQKVAHLPPHTIILFTQYNRDGIGRVASSYEVGGKLANAANAPVFALYDFNLANGAIGGAVVSAQALGAQAGETALAILRMPLQLTEPVTSIPVRTFPMFNWSQIERWNGDASRLPANAIFHNRPSTIWADRPELAAVWIFVFLGFLLAIAALLINWRRRRTAEKCLLESEERYRTWLNAAIEHKRQYEEGLELLLDLNQRSGQMTEQQMCEYALDIAVKATKSEIGYLHLFSEDQKAASLSIWNAEARKQCASIYDNHYPLDAAGLLAGCAGSGRPIIHNDYQNTPGKFPDGHVHLLRHMCVAVRNGAPLHMIVGVGNKVIDYIEEDGKRLQRIANEVYKIVMRRRAEDALHESEARFRLLADLSPGMAWVMNASRHCIWVNKTWLDFTGRSMEQELGKGWWEIVHPDDLESARAVSTRHFETRTPYVNELRIQRHDGQYRWMLDSSYPRFDEHGAFLGYVGSCLDITERKQAELEREQFRTFFTLSLDMMCIAGTDGYFKNVNPSFIKVLGYSKEEMLERPFIDFVIEEDRQKTATEMEEQFRTGSSLDFENRYRCKDGTVKLLSWQAVQISDDNQMIYASARDITRQREAEDQLNKLWLAVEQTSHSIVITDRDGCIEYVNRAFCTVSGYAAEEVLGRNPRLLQSNRTPASTYVEMWNALAQGNIWQGELINKGKDGEIYIESARISPVRQPDGRITHYLAIKEDITEHKRAGDAIRESKVLLQRVIDSTPDWIHVKDKEHRFMLVNQSFAHAFKQTPEDMVGKYDTDFLPTSIIDSHFKTGMRNTHQEDAAVFNGQTIHVPYDKILFDHGEYRVFDMFKVPLRDASQKIYGVLCYRRDITERFDKEQEQKALEAQLRQAQKMELIGHLAGGIAHDFNNILAAMLGYVELLQMVPDIQQNRQWSQYLQEILQAGIRAKELVAQLLTFSLRRDMATEAISVAPVVKEVAQLLRPTMPSSISIKTSIAENLPEVLMSTVHLHQILMNLGINARDAIAGTGTIEIKAEEFDLDAVKACASCSQNFSGRHLVISVRDSGTGISPQDKLKIFDPFFTTKGKGRGSGLGLSVLHGIVHAANGHVELLSAPGEGTEFRIYLPPQLHESGRRPDDVNPLPKNTAVRGHVMVVDDEASIVGFMTALLEGLGCKVTGLTSSTEALRLFQVDPYSIDLVIADQTMPDLSGAELARAMLACRRDIPIVLSTGFSNAIDAVSAREIGIRRFLVKPVPSKVLVDLVVEYLAARPVR